MITIIKICLLYLLFIVALSLGLWGLPWFISWSTSIVGVALMMKMAGGMMFFGFAGFCTCLCVGLISLVNDD
jgi:hypothetical protein